MNLLLIGNSISLVGAIIMVLIGLIKERKNILLAQSVQFLVMGIGNLVLGGITGFVSNVLGIIRNLYCLKYKLPLAAALGFVAVQAAITVGVNNMGWLGWLPVAAALAFTLSINTKNEIILKLVIIFGQVCWTLYDLATKNYTAMALDLFTIVTTVWGIVMIQMGKKAKAE